MKQRNTVGINLPEISQLQSQSIKNKILKEEKYELLTPDNYLKRQTIAFHQYLHSRTPKKRSQQNSVQLKRINPFTDEPRLDSFFDIIPEKNNPLLLPSSSSLNLQLASPLNNKSGSKSIQSYKSFNCKSFSSTSIVPNSTKKNHKKKLLQQKIKEQIRNEEINPTKTDDLAEMVIKQYISNTHHRAIDNQHRPLFVLLDGTVLMNEKVTGIYVDIPRHDIVIKMTKAKRMKTLISLLQKCTVEMRSSTNLLSAFTYLKQPLYDLINLEDDHQYILVSNRTMCYGIHIMPSKSLTKIYNKSMTQFINDKNIRKEGFHKKYKEAHQRKVLEKKLISHNIPKQIDNFKLNKTFTDGEVDTCDIYDYNSDNEYRLKKTRNQINKANINNTHDFQVYLCDKQLSSYVNGLKNKLIYHKKNPFNFSRSFRNYQCDYDKILKRFIKEQNIDESELNPKPKTPTTELVDNIDIHNMLNPNNQYNVIKKEKPRFPYIEKNAIKNDFYQVMDRNLNKKYPDFFSYNIPKFEAKFKRFNRRELYSTFCTFKMLISLCYGMNRNDLVVQNGIDLQTFWKCTQEISHEKKEFVEKLFTQINKTKSNLLSLNDFFEGMTFLQSNDIKEKLDLFLKTLDQSGKGLLSYDDVISICSQSIQRNFTNEDNTFKTENESLTLLSAFFAEFIFEFLNLDKKELIPLERIKEAIVKGSVESQYLEMFCGTSKISNK